MLQQHEIEQVIQHTLGRLDFQCEADREDAAQELRIMFWERREAFPKLAFAYQVARQFALRVVRKEQAHHKTETYVGMDYPATFREPRELREGFRLPLPPRVSPTKLQWRPRGSRATARYEAERSKRTMKRYLPAAPACTGTAQAGSIADASKLVGAGACGLTG